MTCSVIIVSYHTGEVLLRCLNSVLATPEIEVIVVNNGNPPLMNDKLAELAVKGRIQLLAGQGNIGFAKGCNLGASQASQDLLLFLNPDIVATNGAIPSLVGQYRKLAKNTLLSGFICDELGNEQRGLRRNILTPWSLAIEILKFDRLFSSLRSQRFNLLGQDYSGELLTVGACSGACMMVSNHFFQELNGFDENYFLHVEDLDLCRRVKEAKDAVKVYTKARFTHYKSSSEVSPTFVEGHKKTGFFYYFRKFHPTFWFSPLGWGLKLVILLKYQKAKRQEYAKN